MSDEQLREEQANAAMQEAQEKLIPQSKVNELIQTAKMSEREKAQAAREQERQMYEQQAQQAQQRSQQPEVDVNAIADQAYQRLVQEQEQRQAAIEQENLKKHYESLASRFYSKMNEGAAQFDDFNEVMKNFDFKKFPELVELVADLPNTAAVMRELRKNTNLLMTINSLAKTAPEMAEEDLRKLSDSINMNDKALEASRGTRTEPPLDNVNPSRVTNSSGKRSYSDMRYDPKYRV